jgi:hypothetical protein
MTLLKEWWRWFKRQSWLNKVIIVGLSSSLVLFLIPSAVSWLRPTPIHVGVAFYIYERAFILEGDNKTYFTYPARTSRISALVSGLRSSIQVPRW